MHISDMLRQYNRNVSNGNEELRSAQGTQKLVSTIGELSAGSVFEGTVNSVKGGKVTLALGNGQVITARLEGKVDMKPGTAMFFQVKSNDGATVSIRPYSGLGNAGNPILSNALTAAQVPVTERTLAMADAMMQENMSVDRQSILDMAKILNANPNANVQTIVQMTKLGLPVTEEMATQFEHYLSDRHMLLNEMELAINQMTEVLGDEEMASEESFALYNRIVDIFMESDAPQIKPQAADGGLTQQGMADIVTVQSGMVDTAMAEGTDAVLVQSGTVDTAMAEGTDTVTVQSEMADTVIVQGMQQEAMTQHAAAGDANSAGMQAETLGSLLSEEQQEMLAKALAEVPAFAHNTALFIGGSEEELFVDTLQDDTAIVSHMAETAEGTENAAKSAQTVKPVLNKDMPVTEFLRTLQGALSEQETLGLSNVQKLFAGKAFQTLLRGMVEQQWMVKPQDIKEEQRMSKLYEKMERQIGQMESAMKAAGISQNSFLQTASDIRGNIEFMNQVNQIYNYVQIPLKMSGQNANGELYVYTNKKQRNDPEAYLTAFLHLDMENLGATDVSVRMRGREVKTNFYFEDDASYDLVEKHLPILEKHLKKKGYNCTISVTNEKREVNFKENFVKRGRTSAGSVHRYSFDVRA